MTFEWKRPWEKFPGNTPEDDELARETAPGHPMFGMPVRTIAARIDCDDYLFEMLDGSGRYAVVHLTWRKESDPAWPHTEIYASFQEWAEKRFIPDVTDFLEEES